MDDLKYIKKHYGENFAHLCRSIFPTILQTEGLLTRIISESFVPSRELYFSVLNCIPEFQEYIYSYIAIKDARKIEKENVKTPEELLDEAGYILYPECQNENEVRLFMRYYAKNEELCTFNRERLKTCRVWFAVKKNVNEIRREDFPNPERQDEYGTSVISIQCSRNNLSTLSIKNRYNHMVKDPDATFDNDLDNIIEGLSDAFMVHYGLNLIDGKMASFELRGFARASDGKYYKRNIHFNNIDYCENNAVIDHGKLHYFDPDKFLLIDNYLIDFENKKIGLFPPRKLDSFAHSIGKIEKIRVTKDGDNKVIEVTPEKGKVVTIISNKKNQIISLKNENVTKIGYFFLGQSKFIQNLELPNVESVADEFLSSNEDLKNLYMPKLESTGKYFLRANTSLEEFIAPNLTSIKNGFLLDNHIIKKIYVPNLVDEDGYFAEFKNAQIIKKEEGKEIQVETDEETELV